MAVKQKSSKRGGRSRDGTNIAWQNKDVSTKGFAERLKGRNLKVYGLEMIEIEDILPTNLPAIEANELRLDNLFKLKSGEYAIVDYESRYLEKNKIKYLGYIARIAKRLYNEFNEFKPLKVIVIYTADVEEGSTKPSLRMGDVSIDITEAFLAGIESEAIKERLNAKINRHEPFSEDDMMELAIYPLTYKGKGAKRQAIGEAIDIAEKIEDDEMMRDAMTGILAFSDKVITMADANRIREWISMTKVERIIEKEKEQAVKAVENEKIRAEKERDISKAEHDRLREIIISNGINPNMAVQ